MINPLFKQFFFQNNFDPPFVSLSFHELIFIYRFENFYNKFLCKFFIVRNFLQVYFEIIETFYFFMFILKLGIFNNAHVIDLKNKDVMTLTSIKRDKVGENNN